MAFSLPFYCASWLIFVWFHRYFVISLIFLLSIFSPFPPSLVCNRGKQLLGGERGNPPAYGDEAKEALRNNRGNFFHAPVPPQQKEQRQQPDETPMKQRMQPYNPRAALEAPSPMPTWGGRKVKAMALRDASYGEELEVCVCLIGEGGYWKKWGYVRYLQIGGFLDLLSTNWTN